MTGQSVEFAAPWGALLKGVTGLSTVILVGVPLIGMLTGPRGEIGWFLSMVVLPLAILVGAAFFSIRGYVLTAETLIVKRVGWTSCVNLADLRSAETHQNAMSWSIRTCGNGGLFCFAGRFWNRKLGSYRAFATDPKRSVVLRFEDHSVVVTPDNPEAFVARVRKLRSLGVT